MHVRHAMQQHSTEGKNNMQVTNNACEFIKNQLFVWGRGCIRIELVV